MRGPYVTSGECGGLPKVDLATPVGWCVGIVAQELHFPRGMVILPNGDLIVAELGGWAENHGRLSILRKVQGYARSTLFDGLNEPHGVAIGPDKRVYVGMVGSVFRFDPADPAKTREDVLGGKSAIPAPSGTGLHPLTSLVFDNKGDLLTNNGSFTDHCTGANDAPPDASKPCPESLANPQRAVIRRYAMHWPDGRATGFTAEAHGLRNSLALAVHRASGNIWQGENSRDAINQGDPKLSDELLPHDEINLVTAGHDYGWPYCYDHNVASPEFPTYDCKGKTAPVLLLAPHAAPLSMEFDNDAKLPAPYTGMMVLALHGYRKGGHRIVAYKVDAQGAPSGAAQQLVAGWDGVAGHHPLGTPVSARIAPDGSIFITEDRNGTVLKLMKQ